MYPAPDTVPNTGHPCTLGRFLRFQIQAIMQTSLHQQRDLSHDYLSDHPTPEIHTSD